MAVTRPISGAAAERAPIEVVLNALAEPEKRQESDDDDDQAYDVDDAAHVFLLHVR